MTAGYVEIELDVSDLLTEALDREGFNPEKVLVTPHASWFPFSGTSIVRVQFYVEEEDE
ncbi:MAG: hypothetical protein V4510_12840 [bacterium]